MTTDLLPCPFCGSKAQVLHINAGDNAGGTCIECTHCQASSNVQFERKENLVSDWNRRAMVAIECAKCKTLGPEADDADEEGSDENAVKLWNKRALPTKEMIHSAIVCVLIDTPEVRDIGTLTEKLVAALTEPQTALVDPGSSAPPVGVPQPPLVLTREGER